MISNRTISLLIGLSLAVPALVACNKTESAQPGESASATHAPMVASAHPSASASAVASAAPSAQVEEKLPSERKADRKAMREITPTNYKAELGKMDKEIGTP